MFRITARGGKGVTAAKLTGETGALVAAMPLEDIKDLMVGTSKGKLIRMKATDVATQGRDTRGSRLMRLDHGDAIISVIKIDGQEDDEPGVYLEGAV
jgi:DNA gyrase subunit A